jgi:predicted RNA-binding protein with PUA-like domain
MKIGDEVLFYHSQEGNCIMGIMKVSEEAHQDKTTNDSKWVSVTFEPVESMNTPIPLQKIKATKGLENIGLIKQPRLAAMKLGKEEFNLILSLK